MGLGRSEGDISFRRTSNNATTQGRSITRKIKGREY